MPFHYRGVAASRRQKFFVIWGSDAQKNIGYNHPTQPGFHLGPGTKIPSR
jgi:hypothetical protein